MTDRENRLLALFITLSLLFMSRTSLGQQQKSPDSQPEAVEGTVYDAATHDPIPFVTVQVVGADRSTLANEDGHYRIVLPPESKQIRFSHIAYFSQVLDLAADSLKTTHDVSLQTCIADMGVMRVYGRAYDPAQRIIFEAIRRKKDILSRLHDYRCDAYTKLVVYDESKKDSSKIWLLTETQVTTYWEQPGKYKEVITSRRQSANIKAENNLVTVGEILNFNKNRIDLGRYSVVSPTAEDALDHYNYYLMDTLYIDSLAVFLLEVEPKDPNEPLFQGHISIADSTYDVVAVDVGFSRGVDVPMLKSPRYTQRFARFQNEFWMPIEIRLSAGVEFEMAIPGIPKKLRFEHVALLYSYEFDTGLPRTTFDEYAIEVDRLADKFDTVKWFARQTIPLTTEETDAYHRIDSVEHRPKTAGKYIGTGLAGAAYLLLVGQPDFFRFNRVEGPYLGVGVETDKIYEKMKLRLKTGYAFDAKRWQYQAGATWRLHETQRLDLGFDYYNRVFSRPTIISPPNYNSTFWALVNRWDPLEYYRGEGIQAFLSSKLLNHTTLKVAYSDFRQFSMPARTTFGFMGDTAKVLSNPAIVEGTMRSVAADFVYDSRHMFKNKGRDTRIDEAQFVIVATGVEYASPKFIENDFDFRRYYVDIQARRRTLGLGLTSFRLYAGASDGALPPQRYFTVDFGSGYLFSTGGFSTLDQKNFAGNRALAIQVSHDFRRRLFVASGLPLVKDIPLWLSVHGGVFWTEFRNHPYQPGDETVMTAGKPFREIGFGLGNLTPFLAPFNLAVYFNWQLSDYDTREYSIDLGVEL